MRCSVCLTHAHKSSVRLPLSIYPVIRLNGAQKNALFVKWYYYRSFFISAQPLRHSLSLAHSIHDKIHVGTLCTCVIKLWRSCRCRKFNKDFNGCVCVCVCRRLRCFFPSFLKYFLCNLTLICAYLKASNKTS